MEPTRIRRLVVLALALVAAGLACDLTDQVTGSTPQASFSTATPGGSISVSLLTPTLTQPALPEQFTTPIGPVATATAAAMTAAAETATAAAPTPTIPGVFTGPALCPPAGAPSLPNQPPPFNRLAEEIVRYLSGGGAPTILEATLRSWGAITDQRGLVRADRDFTGDGVPEVFVVLLDPQKVESNPQPGDLYLFGCQDGAYRLLYQVGYDPEYGAPEVYKADDINGDHINDLVYSITTCGEQGCTGQVKIVEWNITLGNFSSLLANEITVVEPEVTVSDVDNDGLGEVSVTNGTIPSPEAGPQRETTTIYHWDGAFYAVSQVIRSPIQYRIHALYDGDDALLAGDSATAIDLYKKAADDEALLSWVYPNETQYLMAYAQFRLMLAYVLKNSLSKAQTTHDQLIAQYVQPTPAPDQPTPIPTPYAGPPPGIEFANMADLFWQNFSVNRDLGRACALVVDYARTHPTALDVLNSFGYANRVYKPEDMCPFGG